MSSIAPVAVPLQTATLVIPFVLLAIGIVVVWQMVVVVDSQEKHALTVLGEYEGLLEPGLNVVPPFISSTEPIDMRPQRFDVTADATTQDRVSLTATATVAVSVADAEALFRAAEDYPAGLADRVAPTLAETIRALDSDTLADPDSGAREAIQAELDDTLSPIGLSVESVTIRDVETHLDTDDIRH